MVRVLCRLSFFRLHPISHLQFARKWNLHLHPCTTCATYAFSTPVLVYHLGEVFPDSWFPSRNFFFKPYSPLRCSLFSDSLNGNAFHGTFSSLLMHHYENSRCDKRERDTRKSRTKVLEFWFWKVICLWWKTYYTWLQAHAWRKYDTCTRLNLHAVKNEASGSCKTLTMVHVRTGQNKCWRSTMMKTGRCFMAWIAHV